MQWELRHDGEHFVVALDAAGEQATERELLVAADVLRSHGGLLAGAGVREGRLEIDTKPLDEDQFDSLSRALRGAAEEIIRQREWQRREDEQYREFAARLEEQLGAPPRETGD